jgi:hypothetical protein
VKFLAAVITWLAIMAAGGILLWLAMIGIGLTGISLTIITVGWGVILGALGGIAAVAVYSTFES